MLQSTNKAFTFYQSHATYIHTRRSGWLMESLFLLSAITTFVLGVYIWGTYKHNFTFYLKWQDALVGLLWFLAFLGLCGSVLTLRFLYAAHIGYVRGIFTLVESTSITVCDISAENLASIFWMLNAAFWCFVPVLVGLVPIMVVGWTSHITPLLLTIVTTGIAILLSLAGIVVSITFASFIIIGGFAAVSFWQKLGMVHTYKLDTHTTIHCDGSILTVIYPDMPESMLDLNSLHEENKQLLFTLLYEQWLVSDRLWTLSFDVSNEQDIQKVYDSTQLLQQSMV